MRCVRVLVQFFFLFGRAKGTRFYNWKVHFHWWMFGAHMQLVSKNYLLVKWSNDRIWKHIENRCCWHRPSCFRTISNCIFRVVYWSRLWLSKNESERENEGGSEKERTTKQTTQKCYLVRTISKWTNAINGLFVFCRMILLEKPIPCFVLTTIQGTFQLQSRLTFRYRMLFVCPIPGSPSRSSLRRSVAVEIGIKNYKYDGINN